MVSQKRILVVVDPPSADQPAVDRAAWLAGQMPSTVELLICDYSAALADRRSSDVAVLAAARNRLLAGHRRRLEALAEPLRASGLHVEIDARWDMPLYAGIVRRVVESGADLVLKDTHYLAPLRRSLFSNTDWSLIRACPVTLWLVKPRPFAAKPYVVAAVDIFRKGHQTAMQGFANAHGIAAERVHLAQGVVSQSLVDATNELRADIVAMGAISRTGLKRLFIGSTAETVLDRLSCDLLLVKPDDIAADVG